MANLRISLGVEVRPGKEHAATQGMPGLWQMLAALPRERWPTFVRGDCGYGSEKWTLLLTRVLRHWLGGKWLPGLPAEAGLLLSD